MIGEYILGEFSFHPSSALSMDMRGVAWSPLQQVGGNVTSPAYVNDRWQALPPISGSGATGGGQ
jgi:hypothetical protein